MSTLIVFPDNLTSEELQKVFGDFLEAVRYETETGFVSRMALRREEKEVKYLPAPEGETVAERLNSQG